MMTKEDLENRIVKDTYRYMSYHYLPPKAGYIVRPYNSAKTKLKLSHWRDFLDDLAESEQVFVRYSVNNVPFLISKQYLDEQGETLEDYLAHIELLSKKTTKPVVEL